MQELLRVDRESWQNNHRNQAEFFQKFGDRLPRGIRAEWEGSAAGFTADRAAGLSFALRTDSNAGRLPDRP